MSECLGTLHSMWYTWNTTTNRYVKVVPMHIEEIFSERSLAHWVIEDGYYDGHGRTQTVLLCTESFTKTECELLIRVLANIGITSTLKVRNPQAKTYRIRISKRSMPLLRDMVMPYMHPIFIYKLGLCWALLKLYYKLEHPKATSTCRTQVTIL